MKKEKKLAILLSALIIIILAASIGAYFYMSHKKETGTVAAIYQSGKLIKTVRLDNAEEDYSFTIDSDDGGYNTIEVHKGEIGVTSASCPDKICMMMGFVNTSGLPITCLPNELVIIIQADVSIDAPDTSTY